MKPEEIDELQNSLKSESMLGLTDDVTTLDEDRDPLFKFSGGLTNDKMKIISNICDKLDICCHVTKVNTRDRYFIIGFF